MTLPEESPRTAHLQSRTPDLGEDGPRSANEVDAGVMILRFKVQASPTAGLSETTGYPAQQPKLLQAQVGALLQEAVSRAQA